MIGLKAVTTANLTFQHIENTDLGRIDNFVKLVHNPVLDSGSTYSRISTLWYDSYNLNGVQTHNLISLQRNIYNKAIDVGFGGGNIKGINVQNSGNNILNVGLPFDGCSGNIIVGSGGAFLFSNLEGYFVDNGHKTIVIDHSAGISRINIAVVGCGSGISSACGFSSGFSNGFC